MSTSRDRVRQALSHQGSDRIPVDFGATAVTCLLYTSDAADD